MKSIYFLEHAFRLKNITIYFSSSRGESIFRFQHPPYDIQLASKICEVANREQLDIIHAHYAIPHAVCAIVGRLMAGRL